MASHHASYLQKLPALRSGAGGTLRDGAAPVCQDASSWVIPGLEHPRVSLPCWRMCTLLAATALRSSVLRACAAVITRARLDRDDGSDTVCNTSVPTIARLGARTRAGVLKTRYSVSRLRADSGPHRTAPAECISLTALAENTAFDISWARKPKWRWRDNAYALLLLRAWLAGSMARKQATGRDESNASYSTRSAGPASRCALLVALQVPEERGRWACLQAGAARQLACVNTSPASRFKLTPSR